LFFFLEFSSVFLPLKSSLEGGVLNLELLAELVRAHYDSYLHVVLADTVPVSVNDMYLGYFASSIDVLVRFIANKEASSSFLTK
jgi:hypothetical protein